MDVAAFKTTNDLHNRIDLADMTEKLVAEAFTRACSFYEARDVDELDRGRHDFLRMRKLR